MSDEEKKAIEYLKRHIIPCYGRKGTIEFMLNDIVLNLIEKQSKEIEELKQIKSKLDEKNIPIETLLAEFERLEDLEDDLTTVYLNGVYDGEKKVQDKIKAKIEGYRKIDEEEFVKQGNFETEISVLQSLLEKE